MDQISDDAKWLKMRQDSVARALAREDKQIAEQKEKGIEQKPGRWRKFIREDGTTDGSTFRPEWAPWVPKEDAVRTEWAPWVAAEDDEAAIEKERKRELLRETIMRRTPEETERSLLEYKEKEKKRKMMNPYLKLNEDGLYERKTFSD
jgi:hypothetical protein